MKATKYLSLILLAATALLASCIKDDSNSTLVDFENEYGKNTQIVLEYDTVRSGGSLMHPFNYAKSVSPGQHISLPMTVKYAYPERLKYTWVVIPYKSGSPKTQQIGNKLVYADADTIAHTLDLDYTINLDPENYQFYCIAEDSVTGLSGYYTAVSSYQGIEVAQEGYTSGLYLLCETADGNADIEIFTSALMLIYGGDSCIYKYYTGLAAKEIPGKPRWIRGGCDGTVRRWASKDAFVIATDEGLYRYNKTGMVLMDSWTKDGTNTMFYQKPDTFNPQAFFFTNMCEFLINDGKLYTLYTDKANSRKFSDAIAGDTKNYEAAPFLMKNTSTSWGATPNAIDAAQVIYDKANQRFLPYFAHKNTLSAFSTTSADAYLDANKVTPQPKFMFNGSDNQTYCIMDIEGKPYLYRYQFYNVVDDGDLSADGARSILSLEGCENISKAKIFTDYSCGSALYYTDGSSVYSFSPSTGQTTSNKFFTCDPGYEVTAMYCWGSAGGGWPTSSCVLFIATWNESTKDGQMVQFEMSHATGLPNTMWGPMFGAGDENPVIRGGFQKIVDMTDIDAE